jgi:hypothetical protein
MRNLDCIRCDVSKRRGLFASVGVYTTEPRSHEEEQKKEGTPNIIHHPQTTPHSHQIQYTNIIYHSKGKKTTDVGLEPTASALGGLRATIAPTGQLLDL